MKNKDVIDLINKDGISNTTKQLYTHSMMYHKISKHPKRPIGKI